MWEYVEVMIVVCLFVYEGFGFFVVEVMLCGVFFVLIDGGVLLEVVGDVGIIVLIKNYLELVCVIYSFLLDCLCWMILV